MTPASTLSTGVSASLARGIVMPIRATTCTPTPPSPLDPASGAIKFHFQYTPNDPYDYDGVNETILADIDGPAGLAPRGP